MLFLSADVHGTLGSPTGRAGAKRLRGLTAPIPSTKHPQTHRTPPWLSLRESWREAPERAHRTNSTYNLSIEPPHRFLIRNCILPPTVSTTPLPLPSGGTSPQGARQGPGANFKHPSQSEIYGAARFPNLFVGATCGRPQNVSILSENS